MGPVGSAKGVHHIDIAKACQLFSQLGIIFLFTRQKAHIFQQSHLTGLHLGFFQSFGKRHRLPKLFCKAFGNRGQRELRVVLPFGGAAQVRKKNNACAFLQRQPDGGQGRADALVIGDDAILHGHIEVFANDNGFACEIQILHLLYGHCTLPLLDLQRIFFMAGQALAGPDRVGAGAG